jgi:hypothetical protein
MVCPHLLKAKIAKHQVLHNSLPDRPTEMNSLKVFYKTHLLHHQENKCKSIHHSQTTAGHFIIKSQYKKDMECIQDLLKLIRKTNE